MINLTTEQRRIQELLNQDKLDSQANNQNYQQALSFIRDHLQAFCDQYARDNQLTVSEVAQRISRWDKQQWLQAIRELNTGDWPKEAKERLTSLAKDAGVNVHHMMNAIVGVGVLAYFVRQQAMVQRRIQVDGAAEIARADVKHTGKLVSIVTDPENATRWSANLWEDSDQFVRDLQSVVSKKVRHGTSTDELVNTLVPHSKALERPNTNAADRLAVAKRNVDRLIQTESARVKDRVNMATYRQQGVKYLDWVTEPGACDKCQAIADAGPYPIDDCPAIPDDSHPHCRCSKVPRVNAVIGSRSSISVGVRLSGKHSGAESGFNGLPPQTIWEQKADRLYSEFANRNTREQVIRASKNTGYSEQTLTKVYNHIFTNTHKFDVGQVRRFDPDYNMAQSWSHVISKNSDKIDHSDIIMLNHEYFESVLMDSGMAYEAAHKQTQDVYNYSEELRKVGRSHD